MNEDDTMVKTRHKRKLDALREKDNNNGNIGTQGSVISRGHFEATERDLRPVQRENEGDAFSVGYTDEGMESGEGITGRHDQGIRPIDAAPVPSAAGVDRSDDSFREREVSEVDKLEHERELARQRKQRQRDREKDEKDPTFAQQEPFSGSERDRDRDPASEAASRFHLHNPLKRGGNTSHEAPKLFTSKEVESHKERLAFVYLKGSGLFDDVLQIIVRGHEQVQIWQIDEGEAETLATMHLERAKVDTGAARSARLFLELYERLFLLELVGPRLWATGSYVKENGGLSFK